MISEDILQIGIDPDHWRRLADLFEGGVPKKDESAALVITRNGEPVKALHSKRGVVRGYRFPASREPEVIAAQLEADRLAICDVDAISNIFDAAQGAMAWDGDLVEQFMAMANAGFAAGENTIRWYPDRPFKWRPLKYARAQRLFNILVPDGRTVVVVLMDGGEVYTSLIVGKDKGDIVLMTTLLGVDLEGFDPAKWKRHAPLILERVAKRYAPVYLGAFIDLHTIEEMKAGRRPVRFLIEARKRGTALVKPYPIRLRLLLRLASLLRR